MTLDAGLLGAIDNAIQGAAARDYGTGHIAAVSGGDINDAFALTGHNPHQRYFLKLNRADRLAMFEAEADGLAELRQAVGLRVPEPVVAGTHADWAYLVLEHVELQRPSRVAMTRLGEALVDMHGVVATQHGWHRDNTIGPNPQHNTPHANWAEFWRENRLAVMLDALAPDYPGLARAGDGLLAALPDLLAGHTPEASLLHGDFWGGNVGVDSTGRPAIYDPAVYYGDRETDIALAELFGGFSPDFFEAYWGAWPASAGYREIRRPLYQLYHVLNHVRLFGGGYAEHARRLMRELLAQL